MADVVKLADERRGGLPPWTYFSRDFLELEKEELFRKHWQLACHVCDVPEVGDWRAFDIVGERALIIRGKDDVVRAFHNVCRHRGSRVAAGESGTCKTALVCPFHGWSYNLDGTLRAVPRAKTFPALDARTDGLPPLESEIWNGFVFVRFKAGPQPSVATLMAPFAAEADRFGLANYVPLGGFSEDVLAVNWKSVRDVDNEGYHVPVAHPALHALYGEAYHDGTFADGVSRSEGRITGNGGGHWSVRNYINLRPQNADLAAESQNTWAYYGLWPNLVIMLYPEIMGFYQELPLGVDRTSQRLAYYQPRGGARDAKLARYLARRIDRMTGAEDANLIKWSWESMQSSGFKGIILSDLERGVRDWHDQLRAVIPQAREPREPVDMGRRLD